MKFKGSLLTVLFLTASILGFSAEKVKKENADKRACKYVEAQIELVEKFHSLEEGYSLELIMASKFLGSISKLKSKFTYSYSTATPTSDVDVKVWKQWYEINKYLLYWDNQLKTVRVRS